MFTVIRQPPDANVSPELAAIAARTRSEAETRVAFARLQTLCGERAAARLAFFAHEPAGDLSLDKQVVHDLEADRLKMAFCAAVTKYERALREYGISGRVSV